MQRHRTVVCFPAQPVLLLSPPASLFCHRGDGLSRPCLPGLVTPPLPPERLDISTESEEHLSGALLFGTLVPTQTHSSQLMEQTHTPDTTHTVSPLTSTSLYALRVMLWGLTQPLGVCSCLFFYSSDPNVRIQLQNTAAFIKSRPGTHCCVFNEIAHCDDLDALLGLWLSPHYFGAFLFLVFNLLIEPFSQRNQSKSAPFQSTGRISH